MATLLVHVTSGPEEQTKTALAFSYRQDGTLGGS